MKSFNTSLMLGLRLIIDSSFKSFVSPAIIKYSPGVLRTEQIVGVSYVVQFLPTLRLRVNRCKCYFLDDAVI